MAEYFTQFSCLLPVGSTENLSAALEIYSALDKTMGDEDEVLGFTAKAEPPGDDPNNQQIWLYSDEYGEPEHVIAFVLECAEALGLSGRWGFRWSLSCSRPRLDGHGGGAHMLDLGTRKTIAWIDLGMWLTEQADAASPAHGPSSGTDRAPPLPQVN